MLEADAISEEGFLPKENEELGWEGEGQPLKRKRRDSFPLGTALMVPMLVRASPPCILRNQETMSIKGTSQTQKMRWILTLTSTKGMSHPVMEKQKSREGSGA